MCTCLSGVCYLVTWLYTIRGHKKDVNSKGNGDASFEHNQTFISKTVWSCSQTLLSLELNYLIYLIPRIQIFDI